MSKKRERPEPKPKLKPTQTVANLTDDFMEDFQIPPLPENIPQRLEQAIKARVNSYLFHLKEAKKQKYVGALEIRLVRDAHRAVLTAYELNLTEAEAYYAEFRTLVERLGFSRVDVGFVRSRK